MLVALFTGYILPPAIRIAPIVVVSIFGHMIVKDVLVVMAIANQCRN